MSRDQPRPRAVLYSRLSRESVASTSIAGQADDLFSLAEREGWEVVATFVDKGLSGGKKREAAEESLRMLADGDADILAAYAVDRFSRQGIGEDGELVRVVRRGVERARQQGGIPPRVVFLREGIDSASDPTNWGMRFGMASELAFNERELVRNRQIAARARMRRQGRNAGHGLPPYGYRTGPHPTLPVGRGYHVIPEEATIVREVAARIIADESLVKIAADLTTRGIPTATSPARRAALARLAREHGEKVNAKDAAILDAPGDAPLDTGVWALGRIRSTWTSDHLLGRVSHNGEPLYDDATGAPLAPFEPILSLDVARSIRARFDASTRGPAKRRATALLSSVAYCSGCGGRLYPRATGRLGYLSYTCSASGRGRECERPVSMTVRKLDSAVSARYLAMLGDFPEVQVVDRFDDDGAAAELADTEARLQELAARLVSIDNPSEVESLLDTVKSPVVV